MARLGLVLVRPALKKPLSNAHELRLEQSLRLGVVTPKGGRLTEAEGVVEGAREDPAVKMERPSSGGSPPVSASLSFSSRGVDALTERRWSSKTSWDCGLCLACASPVRRQRIELAPFLLVCEVGRRLGRKDVGCVDLRSRCGLERRMRCSVEGGVRGGAFGAQPLGLPDESVALIAGGNEFKSVTGHAIFSMDHLLPFP